MQIARVHLTLASKANFEFAISSSIYLCATAVDLLEHFGAIKRYTIVQE